MVDHHVLNVDPTSGRYDFRHALFREAVYQDLQPGERIKVHRAIAELLCAQPALAADGTEAGAAAELATHWLRAQDHSGRCRRRTCREAGVPDPGARCSSDDYRTGTRALGPGESTPETVAGVDRLGLLREAAAASGAAGDFARALHLARAALDQARVMHPTCCSAPCTPSWPRGCGSWADGSRPWRQGRKLRRLLSTEAPSIEWAELLPADAGILVMRGRFADAEDDARRAVALPASSETPTWRATRSPRKAERSP